MTHTVILVLTITIKKLSLKNKNIFVNHNCNYTPCFRKKTSTHITGYKLTNSCLILIIFDIKIPHITLHRKTA